jgi:hypothetical protein
MDSAAVEFSPARGATAIGARTRRVRIFGTSCIKNGVAGDGAHGPLGLDADQAQDLAEVLGVDASAVTELVPKFAAAALTEYWLAFTGTHAPTSIRDLRELRLALLFEALPPGQPTDEQVAALFQLTPTQSASLIAGARARHARRVEGRLREAAKAALETATKPYDRHVRVVMPASLATYLKDLVRRTGAPPIEKQRGTSRTYDLEDDTVKALCGVLGMAYSALTVTVTANTKQHK